MWRSGRNILQSVLSFYHVGPRINPVVRLGGEFLHPQSHLTGPIAGYSLILLLYILKGLIFIFNFVYLCVGMYTCADACRVQKRASNPPELGFQEAVSCVMWLLETDPGSPALNSQAVSLAPFSNFSSGCVSITLLLTTHSFCLAVFCCTDCSSPRLSYLIGLSSPPVAPGSP